MVETSRKRDRTARLLRLQMLLWQYPHGLEIKDIARKCSISERTTYRDLEALESELGVPIWEDGSKRGISEGYFLPPISFTMTEAMDVFLAARLLQNFSHWYSPGIASTFLKLSAIVPEPLRKQIQDTIEYIEKQPRNERRIRNFDKLVNAWISQHRVKIRYQDLSTEEPAEYIIEPYFIEPAAWGRSSYVIANLNTEKTILTFKIDQIIDEVTIEPETYEIPSDFKAIEYLGSAWGIYTDKELVTVKLRFSKKVSKATAETIWHPSQKTEKLGDGSIIITLKVRNTVDFRGWVLGWGENVEVLGPPSFRKQIIRIMDLARGLYKRKPVARDN
jgi:predicted DNA-binding transcriptional regulator YafY